MDAEDGTERPESAVKADEDSDLGEPFGGRRDQPEDHEDAVEHFVEEYTGDHPASHNKIELNGQLYKRIANQDTELQPLHQVIKYH